MFPETFEVNPSPSSQFWLFNYPPPPLSPSFAPRCSLSETPHLLSNFVIVQPQHRHDLPLVLCTATFGCHLALRLQAKKHSFIPSTLEQNRHYLRLTALAEPLLLLARICTQASNACKPRSKSFMLIFSKFEVWLSKQSGLRYSTISNGGLTGMENQNNSKPGNGSAKTGFFCKEPVALTLQFPAEPQQEKIHSQRHSLSLQAFLGRSFPWRPVCFLLLLPLPRETLAESQTPPFLSSACRHMPREEKATGKNE